MESKYPMLEVELARNLIKESISGVSTEVVPIQSAKNRVLSEDLNSRIDFPQFRASIMDGYAVKSQDTPGILKVAGKVHAGEESFCLEEGNCFYITTGAALPLGSDAVVPIEKVTFHENGVEVPKAAFGEWIREVGSDVKCGEVVARKGDLLRPEHIALLISLGISQVSVYRKIKVGLASTGNELKEVGEELSYGEIHDTNKTMLKMLLEEEECQVLDKGILKDQKELVRTTLQEMVSECDIVVTSGGVSMGEFDYVKPILEEIGTVKFGRVNMKPGKPTTFALVGTTLVFGLPGNPVSCYVCYYLFVCYAIRLFHSQPDFPIIQVNLGTQSIKLDKERPEYHRSIVAWSQNEFQAVSTGFQRSSRLLSTVNANALLMLPKGTESQATLQGKVSAMLVRAVSPMLPGMQPLKVQSHQCAHFSSVPSYTTAVLTVSDRVSRNEMEDKSGKYLKEVTGAKMYAVVPDEKEQIKAMLENWSNQGVGVVLTTGGTGLSSRDVTPEATQEVITREVRGLSTLMMTEGLKHTPMASLSRGIVGVINKTLVVNMPGSLNGVKESYSSLESVLPHAIKIINS